MEQICETGRLPSVVEDSAVAEDARPMDENEQLEMKWATMEVVANVQELLSGLVLLYFWYKSVGSEKSS